MDKFTKRILNYAKTHDGPDSEFILKGFAEMEDKTRQETLETCFRGTKTL